MSVKKDAILIYCLLIAKYRGFYGYFTKEAS